MKPVERQHADALARGRAVAAAEQAFGYVWHTDQALLVHYNYGLPGSFDGQIVPDFSRQPALLKPAVVMGQVRGIPYTRSFCGSGGGHEDTPEEFYRRDGREKAVASRVYFDAYDGEYCKIGPKYGMASAAFVSACIRAGFDTDAFRMANQPFEIYERNRACITNGAHDYASLQPGDYLYRYDHVMLVTDNDGNRITVIHQMAPVNSRDPECRRRKNVKAVIRLFDGSETTIDAVQLCMDCEACRKVTTGTRKEVFLYREILDYAPMYVSYPESQQGCG